MSELSRVRNNRVRTKYNVKGFKNWLEVMDDVTAMSDGRTLVELVVRSSLEIIGRNLDGIMQLRRIDVVTWNISRWS